MLNSAVVRLVAYAYALQDYQVIGGPDWARRDRFDIIAKAASPDASTADIRLMLQSLLEERFGLVTHTERREMRTYALLIDRQDGRLGPGLTRVNDCTRRLQRPSNVPAGAMSAVGCGAMASLAQNATILMGAPVIDRTGLDGLFESVYYFAEQLPGGRISSSASPDLPVFTTALREQLGLKLEPVQAQVEVTLIDSVQRPSEN